MRLVNSVIVLAGVRSGAPGRTRTSTPLQATDFESAASTIPPLGHGPIHGASKSPGQPRLAGPDGQAKPPRLSRRDATGPLRQGCRAFQGQARADGARRRVFRGKLVLPNSAGRDPRADG